MKTKTEKATKPLARRTTANSLTAELNVHGFNFDGFANLMPNPDPILRNMGWNKDVEAYRELLSDPQLYGTIENNRKPGVKSLLTYIDKGDDTTSDEELDFIRAYFKVLTSDNIYDNITSHSLDTPLFGRMVFGLVWAEVDGYFIPTMITPIPHDLCRFSSNGELLVSNETGVFAKPSHPARYLVLRHKPTIANPYGESLLSRCYWNIRFKKEGMKMWALFTEKFGMPWVSASYNPQLLASSYNVNDTTTAAEMLLDSLATMARDGIIVFPDGASVNMLDGGKISSIDVYERFVRICDEQNTKLLLGHNGATDSTPGKLGNDNTALDVRQHIIDADKMFPITLWNRVIEWIHYFNFATGERPVFDLYAKEEVDMTIAERDAKLVPVLTLSGQKFSKSYLTKTYGLEDDDIEAVDVVSPAPVAKKVSALNHQIFASSKPDYPDQDLIDNQTDKSVSSSTATDEMIADVIAMINSLDGFDEVKKEIGKMLDEVNSDNFEETISNLMFVADVVGRLSVDSEVKGLK